MEDTKVKEGDRVHYLEDGAGPCEWATVGRLMPYEGDVQYVVLNFQDPPRNPKNVQFNGDGRPTNGSCHLPESCQDGSRV